MRLGGTSGVRIISKGIARAINPSGASGRIGATTTMWAQQQRQPSPEPPSSESLVVWWLEKTQESGEMSWQAQISVAAISRSRTVETSRTVGQSAINVPIILY